MSTVTKTHKTKSGTIISTTYHTEATFKPKKISEISMEFIEAYCVANKELDWLLETVNKPFTYTYKKGKNEGKKKSVDYPFVNIRKDFVAKFFPEILVGEKKTETLRARLNRLYAK